MFRKILVANRGEIARRVFRACQELGIGTAAVHSEADRTSPYVAQADEAHLLGPAPPRESYLRIDRILDIARRAGCDAIHPGYGFLSENADFSEACAQAGIAFIGPGAEALRALGNKVQARRLAERLGVPVIPGISDAVDERAAAEFARRHRFPILLKAAGGGGGRGLRVVRQESELARALREAGGEALSAFGDPSLFVEKLIERPRHVEIQVLADGRGNAIHLGERECSIQRRHQKLVEESPSVAVDENLRARLGETAVRLFRAAGYRNAGTCEFLLDEERRFYFLEVNARLQVEHPVTEAVTGIDLVGQQILIAAGEPLGIAQEDLQLRGHAIECRICAEDPRAGFTPSMGEITDVQFPAGPGVRVDSDLAPHQRVTAHYDSLLAKLIAWAATRDQAIARMVRALREFFIAGVRTTIPFHVRLLQNREFRDGRIHTQFVDGAFDARGGPDAHRVEAALLAAALEIAEAQRRVPQAATARKLSPWQTAWREPS